MFLFSLKCRLLNILNILTELCLNLLNICRSISTQNLVCKALNVFFKAFWFKVNNHESQNIQILISLKTWYVLKIQQQQAFAEHSDFIKLYMDVL